MTTRSLIQDPRGGGRFWDTGLKCHTVFWSWERPRHRVQLLDFPWLPWAWADEASRSSGLCLHSLIRQWVPPPGWPHFIRSPNYLAVTLSAAPSQSCCSLPNGLTPFQRAPLIFLLWKEEMMKKMFLESVSGKVFRALLQIVSEMLDIFPFLYKHYRQIIQNPNGK